MIIDIIQREFTTLVRVKRGLFIEQTDIENYLVEMGFHAEMKIFRNNTHNVVYSLGIILTQKQGEILTQKLFKYTGKDYAIEKEKLARENEKRANNKIKAKADFITGFRGNLICGELQYMDK
jgi:hypothetical protein